MVQARSRTRVGRFAAACSVVALVGLAACGGGDVEQVGAPGGAEGLPGVSGDRGIVLAAAVRSVDDGTARIAATTEMGSLLSVSIDGVVDFESGDSQMTVDMGALSGFAGLLGGEEEETPDPEDFALEVRTVDGRVYVRVPAALAGQYPGTEAGEAGWLAVDTVTLTDASDSDLEQLREQADPRAYLSYLQRASDDIEATGREEVRGTDTTRYEGTIDLTDDLADLPADARRQLDEEFGANSGEMLDQLGTQLGLDALPFTVWIDDEGRMRKMEIAIDLGGLIGEGDGGSDGGSEGGDEGGDMAGLLGTMFGGGVSVAVELYDYGVDVDVEAPPADEVNDLTPEDLGVPGDDSGDDSGDDAGGGAPPA